MLDDGLGLVEGFHPPRLGRLACFVFLPYLPDRRPGRGREHARQFVDCDQLRSLLGTVGHLCHGRDIPVVRFAEVVDEAHQQYPLHVQPGAFAGEDGGQQGQPPRVLGRAFVPPGRGVCRAQDVFQPFGLADEPQVAFQLLHTITMFVSESKDTICRIKSLTLP